MTTKALYNALRLYALDDPKAELDSWKMLDLRTCTPDQLFSYLEEKGIHWDRQTFIAYANEYDTPEELFEALCTEEADEAEDRDFLYLILFELWRRFANEKQCVSLIADELDYQIYLYDNELLERLEPLDDAIACFYEVLEENVDLGIHPQDAFQALVEYCAHDIFSFLYDYISELIELGQDVYAQDLVERFFPFIDDRKWFEFLHAELIATKEPQVAIADIKKIAQKNKEPELFLDMLAFLCRFRAKELFCQIAQDVLKCTLTDDDLDELVYLSKEFFSSHKLNEKVQEVEDLEGFDKEARIAALQRLYRSV